MTNLNFPIQRLEFFPTHYNVTTKKSDLQQKFTAFPAFRIIRFLAVHLAIDV